MTGVSVVYVVSIRTTQMERLNVMQQLDRFPTATIMWGSLNHDSELTEVGRRDMVDVGPANRTRVQGRRPLPPSLDL